MNIWLIPTANPIWNTLIRSVILVVALVFGVGISFYHAYWAAIVHDIISLTLIRPLV